MALLLKSGYYATMKTESSDPNITNTVSLKHLWLQLQGIWLSLLAIEHIGACNCTYMYTYTHMDIGIHKLKILDKSV